MTDLLWSVLGFIREVVKCVNGDIKIHYLTPDRRMRLRSYKDLNLICKYYEFPKNTKILH